MFVFCRVKKDKMVSCGAPGYTNRADKSCNIIILVTIIIILLNLYRGIFRTLAYVMLEAYSKVCQISKIIKYIEKPVIVTTVYQGHSAIFSHAQTY